MIYQFKCWNYSGLCTDVPLPSEKIGERDICESPSLTRNSRYLVLSLDQNFTKIYPDNSNSGSCDSRMPFQALAHGCTISKNNYVTRQRLFLICAFYHNKCIIMSPLAMTDLGRFRNLDPRCLGKIFYLNHRRS